MGAILLPRPTLMTALDIAPPADALQAIVHADPAPYYAELAANRPFFFDTALGWWVAASAEAVGAVLSDAACRVRPADEPAKSAGSPGDAASGGVTASRPSLRGA